jgi:membrane protease YdiL (CAAX protease family)
VVGALVGVQLGIAPSIAPAEVIDAVRTVNIPLGAKILYGGITEEVLMRWGLMTAMIWLPWHIWQRKTGAPKRAYVVSAIVLTAVLFGVGHLPAAMAMGIELTGPVIAYIVVGNTLPGALFGVLYWRRGIEAAMIAHALGHVISTVAANV